MVVLFATVKELWKLIIKILLSYIQQKGDTDIWLNFMFKINYLYTLRAEFHKVVRQRLWQIFPGFSCNYSSFYNSERILKISQHLTKLVNRRVTFWL